jgi:hypothetical protein
MAVSVGYVRPMKGQGIPTPPPPPAEQEKSGWQQFLDIFGPAATTHLTGVSGGGGGAIGPNMMVPGASELLQSTRTPAPLPKAIAQSPAKGPVSPPPPGMSFEDYIMSMGLGGGGGGGGSRPDFSGYRNALMGQADELNARIQAMYNQLGEQAGANVGRIQDIYGGAQTGVGDIYDSATGNIQQAFSSAQQQAADQMARLGIEAAAPAVMDPMALSQAQAVSGLETGRAGGLSALERYGATASDFGSQMAQTAQQQGTEMNAAILASLQNRLAESLAAEQAGGGGGGGGGRGMSVSDMLKLREAYGQDVLGELPLGERRLAFDIAESAARPLVDWANESTRRYMQARYPQGSRIDSEQYLAEEEAVRRRYRQQVGLE